MYFGYASFYTNNNVIGLIWAEVIMLLTKLLQIIMLPEKNYPTVTAWKKKDDNNAIYYVQSIGRGTNDSIWNCEKT